MIAIRWPPQLLQGIEKYAHKQSLERSDALRQIVGRFLLKRGLIHGRLEPVGRYKGRRKKSNEVTQS